MTILTLCYKCVTELDGFSVKRLAHETTTEKKERCDWCGERFPADILNQYVIQANRRKR